MTRFIAGVRLDRRLQRFRGRGFFAYEAVFTGMPGIGASHVVFGGQRPPIALAGQPGVGLTRRLGFPAHIHVTGRTVVNGAPAVVVLVPSSPRAGLNSGHLVVAWNAGGAAYFTSVHLEQLTFSRRLATARALAVSVAPVH